MKLRLILTVVGVVAIAGIFLAGYATAGFSGGGLPGGTTEPSDELLDEVSTDFDIFWEAWDRLQNNYYEGPRDIHELVRGASHGMIAAVGDPNTVFVDPEPAQIDRERLEGKFEGIGATVELDEDGHLETAVAAHDVGRAINPRHCVEQVQGAAAMTLGFALFESMRIEDGRLVNGSFLEYPLTAFEDMPREFITDIVENPLESGPYGARGVGETGTMALKPAIVNAIHDAVGIWLKDMPVTPEKVLRAMREASGAAPGKEASGAAPDGEGPK